MGFMEKLEKFHKYMSEPAFFFIWETDDEPKKQETLPEQEVIKLIPVKKPKEIEQKCKQLEYSR